MSTEIKGGVQYAQQVIEAPNLTLEGRLESEWNTRKTVSDPDEHARAIKLRTKVRGLILSATAASAFGAYLAPEEDRDKVFEAITEGRRLVDEFNASASYSRIHFNTFVARVAQDDVTAVKNIAAELRSLMDDMKVGLRELDVKAVRDAANKATQMGRVLSPEASDRVQVAIKVARRAARQMAKAGDAVVKQIDRQAIRQVDRARTSFLDFVEESIEADSPEMSARSVELVGV
jgi:hypothetical protein